MTQSVIQYSFNSGEWAPSLNARVDLTKYHSGAALLRNWFVDYRGGATTRPGTQYILQTRYTTQTRLIPFQASQAVGYVIEFGELYARFYYQGNPVLETAQAMTSATSASPGVFTKNSHSYLNGDWVFGSAFTGTGWTNFNGSYFIVANKTANTFELTDLNGVAISTNGFVAFTAGSFARVYTITSPYAASEVTGLNYAQDVNQMIFCHPNHPPYVLTLTSATSWALTAITFASAMTAPTGQSAATTLGAGSVNYAYVVTAVNAAGDESGPSSFATLASKLDIRSTAGTNTITWSAVTNAAAYNVYRAQLSYAGAVPAGSVFGFIGSARSTSFIDSNITPDFSITPPVPTNPFSGSGIGSVTVNNGSSFSGTFGPVTFTGGGGSGAAALATAQIASVTVTAGGSGWAVGELANVPSSGGATLRVATIGVGGSVATFTIVNPGSIQSPTTCPPTAIISHSPGGNATVTLTWTVVSVDITNPGTGYGSPPTVAVTGVGGGSFTAVVGAASAGNPTVPNFFQQRMILAGPVSAPNQFNMSKPGSSFNFDISSIIQPSDAISGSLRNRQLQTIRAMVQQPSGLITFTDQQTWLTTGASGPGSAISATGILANSQSFNGVAANIPPIIATNNIVFVQAKGSIVRDMAYDVYTNVYKGMDISAVSSHLFYGYTIHEWAWAEEPYKVLWAVRSDGALLSLTYLKEQDFIAWTAHDTEGSFASIASVVETTTLTGQVDAVYFVVQRTINGNTVQYVERLADLSPIPTIADAWQVDAGLTYSGTAALTFTGLQHLAGMSVTGIATTDGTTPLSAYFAPVTVSASGSITLPAPTDAGATGYTYVLAGLAFTPQLTTLPVDVGEPTVQGGVKAINAGVLRVKSALGLEIGAGTDFSDCVPMKDLVVGNVSSMLTGRTGSQIITDLVTGDARTFLNPQFATNGQISIQQPLPYPATVLGIIADITWGDERRRGG